MDLLDHQGHLHKMDSSRGIASFCFLCLAKATKEMENYTGKNVPG